MAVDMTDMLAKGIDKNLAAMMDRVVSKTIHQCCVCGESITVYWFSEPLEDSGWRVFTDDLTYCKECAKREY